jgi:hypothetical protein
MALIRRPPGIKKFFIAPTQQIFKANNPVIKPLEGLGHLVSHIHPPHDLTI